MKILLFVALYFVIGFLAIGLFNVIMEIDYGKYPDNENAVAYLLANVFGAICALVNCILDRELPIWFKIPYIAGNIFWPITIVISIIGLKCNQEAAEILNECYSKREDKEEDS